MILSSNRESVQVRRAEPGQGLSRTAPGRLQGMEDDSDDENSHLLKVITAVIILFYIFYRTK